MKKKEPPPTKLDLGCGSNKQPGFFGVDRKKFPGVDHVMDLGDGRWPWASNSIEEAYCSHFIEHLTWPERVHFFNELYRVLKKGAKVTLILPHWCSNRYYGDPTHKEPFSEMAFYYLRKTWREQNAPHVDYTCDFEATWAYGLNPAITTRNQEFQLFAIQYYKDAITDIHATLVKI